MRLLLPTFIVVLCLCGGALHAADLSDQEHNAARKLYLGRCAKCHKLYDPAGYSDSGWASWMVKMNKKAHLNSDQAKLLARYLDSVRTERKADGKKTAYSP
jgi:hypothetical protein